MIIFDIKNEYYVLCDRKNKYDLEPKLAEVITTDILSANEFRPFWFSWADGKIRFGKGTVVGQQVVVEYQDPNPIPVYHLAISGWDVFGTVKIHRGLFCDWFNLIILNVSLHNFMSHLDLHFLYVYLDC